jgi:hypothetical protein
MHAVLIIELSEDRVIALLERLKPILGEDQDYLDIKASLESCRFLTQLLDTKDITIKQLRDMLFGASTEKTSNVLKDSAADAASQPEDTTPAATQQEPPKPRPRPPGHGRNGAGAYPSAKRMQVPHESLKAGQPCPRPRCKGTLYRLPPGVLVRIIGQAPLQGTVYELEKLRCNLCGKVQTAQPPESAGTEKYDATAASMIGMLRYGYGLPWNRLAGLQQSFGIPLPASTQWDVVHRCAELIVPAYHELIRQAAQGEVIHNDDTNMKILAYMGEQAKQLALGDEDHSDERTGIFTTGIVSIGQGRKIAVFFTGRKHAGENLAELLAQRATQLPPPIQMCDALSRNLPKEFQVLLANCLAHSRRKYVQAVVNFPDECRYVLETLAEVYRHDAFARKECMSPEDRLRYHQEKSKPLMDALENWMRQQFELKLVEPNSGLGEAIKYMTKHWSKLTLFLREPGAPLDNNVCERALKKAIIHRKNSLFYKTQNGARVGDLFMSIIYTCQLNKINAFEYLTQLQFHAKQLAGDPSSWMPWNYQSKLTGDLDKAVG